MRVETEPGRPRRRYVLRAASAVTPERLLIPGYVAVDGERIAGVGENLEEIGPVRSLRSDRVVSEIVIDVGERILAPGFFDVHVHGGDGAQVNGERPADVTAALERIGRFHARHGTTSFLATTVSDSPADLLTTAGAAGELTGRRLAGGATVRGVHLEGPWIARAKQGAHDPRFLRRPDPEELRSLAEASGGAIRMVTLAPELPGSDALMRTAGELGVGVAIGHTDAGFEAVQAAIALGARHATHLFNTMPPIHHRRPGAVAALLLDERVTLEVIADLEHVHPAVLSLVGRCAPGRLVAVSDAVPAAGLEPGTYQIGQMDVSVEAGRVTLATDPAMLAGSVLTMEVAVRNLVVSAGLPMQAAIAAATSVPARAVGCAGDGLGSLVPGAPADLVILEPEPELAVATTIVGGEVVFDQAGCLGAVAEAGF